MVLFLLCVHALCCFIFAAVNGTCCIFQRGCDFIDDEAELSDDVAVSSDEGDDNLEMFEGSFIDNCTQMTQASQIGRIKVLLSMSGAEPLCWLLAVCLVTATVEHFYKYMHCGTHLSFSMMTLLSSADTVW